MILDDIALNLQNVTYFYNDKENAAISDICLKVKKGSFTTILGPSGCGKTTLLRCISGFLTPSSGSIFISGKDQYGIEPEKRQIGMVFQDYALFPHLTVEANILYGLKIHRTYINDSGKTEKYSKAELKDKVVKIAESLDLVSFLNRYPSELSGGQQQRVALARALVLNPQILLMDEPLSSLDTKLREKVREELKAIQRKLGITTIYVTHDQEEALSLSDEIAVINEGKLLQVGTPWDLYFEPASPFVADFIGRANFLEVEGQTYVVRPEWFSLNHDGDRDKVKDKINFDGIVKSVSFLGDKTRFLIQVKENITMGTGINILTADLPTLQAGNLKEGSKISLSISHKWKL